MQAGCHSPRIKNSKPGKPLGLDVTPVILAGGLGARLQPALPDCPKVLAPVRGRPFITFLFDQIAGLSPRNVVLLTGYRSTQIKKALGDRYGALSLVYSVEVSPLGTGGALRQALGALDSTTVLLMNGDSFCEVDLPGFLARHRQTRADLSMVLTRVADTRRFGQVHRNAYGRITHFAEKQETGGVGWINAGIYLLDIQLVRELPKLGPVSLEREMLPLWMNSRRLYGFLGKDRFLDIGTPSSYGEADAFFLDNGKHVEPSPDEPVQDGQHPLLGAHQENRRD